MRALGVVAAALMVVAVAACGGPATRPGEGVSVVATTTVLGDIAGRVVECGGGTVRTLMPVGADPHDYAPSSTDVRNMVGADLVVANGLGLEEGLSSAIEAAREDGAKVVEVAELVDPIPLTAESSTGATAGSTTQPGPADAASLDPHVWLDVARMADAASLIGAQLTKVTGEEVYSSCGTRVATQLRAVDGEVRDILAAVPPERRVLITDHRAFGYFAQAYGFEVAGVVVPGGSTLGEPSSAHLAELAAVIKDTGVNAIFGNVAEASKLLTALSQETGRKIEVVRLYVGSLGPEGSGAEDYGTMMVTNARLIADALTR